MLLVGSVIVIGSRHAEPWGYIDWIGYSAVLVKYEGYYLWKAELIEFPELIIGIHYEDCNIILN